MNLPKITAMALVLASCAGAKPTKTAAPEPARPAEAAATRNVAIVIYKGVELLDFAGPGEVFASAGHGAFEVFTVASTIEPITSQGFVKILPDHSIDTSPKPDVIVIPGGNVSAVYDDPKMMDWIKKSTEKTDITMSVCNGAIALAKTGLLDGLKATTHYHAVPALQKFPKVTVLPDERFVDNGHIVTTQGVSAGIDGALHVVERLLGDEAAWSTARYMMYRWEPPGLSKEAKDELRPWIEQDWKSVRTIYEHKAEANAKDPVALTRLGIAQEELGEHERAVATLERAIAVGSRDPLAFDDLGEARLALGQFEAAARAHEQEVLLAPPAARPRLQVHIAKLWLRAGNKDAAIASLQNAVTSGQVSKKSIENDADFASLRGHPRWVAILERAP
jgi:transcriptional regulator GlxA family with amidase domain